MLNWKNFVLLTSLLSAPYIVQADPVDPNGAGLQIVIHQEAYPKYALYVSVDSLDGHIHDRFLTSTGISIPVVDGDGKLPLPTQTSTREGMHKVLRIDADHVSSEFEGAPMYHAVFFDASGQALHETPATNYQFLGRPKSHGCARLDKESAAKLFGYVQEYQKPDGSFDATVEVRGHLAVSQDQMINAFKNVDVKLDQKRQYAENKGGHYPLPKNMSAAPVKVYGRTYIRDASTGVWLADGNESNFYGGNGTIDYSGDQGYQGQQGQGHGFDLFEALGFRHNNQNNRQYDNNSGNNGGLYGNDPNVGGSYKKKHRRQNGGFLGLGLFGN